MAKRTDLKPFRLAGGVAVIAEAGTSGKKIGRFSGRAYTGAVMSPNGWMRLILDLTGGKIPSQHRPMLWNHNHEAVAGHTESVKVGPEGVDVDGIFSGEDKHVKEITGPASRGFQWQLSIGGNPIRLEYLEAGKETEVNGRTVTGPLDIAREWELGEVSFVPLGADGDTSVKVAASKRRGKQVTLEQVKAALQAMKKSGTIQLARYSDEDIDAMDDDSARATLKRCMAEDDGADKAIKDKEKKDKEDEAADVDAAADDDVEAAADDDEPSPKKSEAAGKNKLKLAAQQRLAAQRKADADEMRRVSGIKARCQKYKGIDKFKLRDGTVVDLIPHAIEAGWSADKTEQMAELHELRANRPGAGVGQSASSDGPNLHFPSTPEMSERVLECAIFQAMEGRGQTGFQLMKDDFYLDEDKDGNKFRRQPESVQKRFQMEHRQQYPEKVQDHAHRIFKSRIGCHDFLSHVFRLGGYTQKVNWKAQQEVRDAFNWLWMSQNNSIQAEGASNVSTPNVFANVLNKYALQGYLFTEGVWREFCGIRPVNDFKPTKSIALTGDVIYKMIGPSGELENATLGDQAFPNQAFNFGRILTIPWMMIVNDDLSIFSTVPQKLGQGAGLALNDMIWSLITSLINASIAAGGSAGNPYGAIQVGAIITADDGLAFFRTTTNLPSGQINSGTVYYNKNKLTGAGSALSATSLQTAKAAYDNQLDPNGNPLGFDGSKPRLLCGPTNWQTMRALMQADMIAQVVSGTTLQPNKNVWNDYATPMISRYMENANYVNSTVAWFLMFDPTALPTIEVCFLNGVDTPAVLMAGPDFQFDRPGMSIRATMAFGATQQNFRGAIYNAGQ